MAVFCCSLSVAALVVLPSFYIGCFAIADGPTLRPENYSPICVPTIEDHQQFYSKETLTGDIDNYWIDLQDQTKHHRLSNSTGGFDRVNLTFGFPFYGQTIKHVYLTTKGILSMSPDLEKVPVSHFVYPYIGHFNPNLSEDSAIYFDNTDDKLIVEWRNVFLEMDNETTIGPYQFQTTVHQDGTILFLYKKVPPNYYFNGTLAGLGSGIDIIKTDLDEMHTILGFVAYPSVPVDANHIRDGAVIKFTPLSNCELARNSQTCTSDRFLFYCKTCKVLKHCSDETDRRVLQWLRNNCKHEIPDNCRTNKTDKYKSSSRTVAIVVIIAVVIVLISLLGGWTYYAYNHPNTPSGRWLIMHRPSQWLGLYRNRKGSSMEDQDRTSQEAEDNDPGY